MIVLIELEVVLQSFDWEPNGQQERPVRSQTERQICEKIEELCITTAEYFFLYLNAHVHK